MLNQGAERKRRTRQFENVLHFTSALRSGDEGCDAYVILDELRPGDGPGRPMKQSLAARREFSLAAVVGGGTAIGVGPMEWDEPGAESDEDDGAPRFVQFCFAKDWFFVDLPSTTLAGAEADRILRERTGFRFIGTGAPLHYSEATVRAFNPLAKVYLHGDERLAAEELAYIWFDVWGLPVDTGLLATACIKGGRPQRRRSMLLL